MTNKPPVLRPADTLRKEDEAKRQKNQNMAFDAGLQRAIKEIEKAHGEGKTSVYTMGFPDSVVKELRSKGYTVRVIPVDMSAEISW